MSRHIDAIEELIDGALAGQTSMDAMRWSPEADVQVYGATSLVAVNGVPTNEDAWRVFIALAHPDVVSRLWEWAREVCRVLGEWVRSVLDSLGSILQEVRGFIDQHLDGPKNVERLRHGSASVCPRHGPTKGGLCRRCQR